MVSSSNAFTSPFAGQLSSFRAVSPLDVIGASTQSLSALFPSLNIPVSQAIAAPSQGNFISPITALQQAPTVRSVASPAGLGGTFATAPVTPTAANSSTKNIIRIVTPQLQAALIGAYSRNNDAAGNLNPQGINADSGGRGLSAFVIPYAAEVKAAGVAIAQGAQNLSTVPKRNRDPGGLAPFMSFDGSAADNLLMAFMVYKNGTYNNGVLGQYDLPRMVNVWESRVGPLPPAVRQSALSNEVVGMSLVYDMVKGGVIQTNEIINPDGSSPLGLWPNTPRMNQAYLNAITAVRSGVMDQDLKKSVLARQDTTGNIAAFQSANARGFNNPETPVRSNNLTGNTNQAALANFIAVMSALLSGRR